MFAMSRTERVIGRMRLLTSSINVRAGVRIIGDPSGTRWDRKLDVLFHEKNMMILSQNASPIGKTIEIWELIVNIVGIIDIKLRNRITENRGNRKEAVIFLEVALISLKMEFMIFLNIDDVFVFIIKIGDKKNSMGIIQDDNDK